MKVEIKNKEHKPNSIRPLIEYFYSLFQLPVFKFKELIVEIDPTIDCKANNALIRWTDLNEGFNDKIIVNSLEEFQSDFRLLNA